MSISGGETDSSNIPTVNAFQGNRSGGVDGYVAVVDLANPGLRFASYAGGSGSDIARAVLPHSTGIFLAGETGSSNYPTNAPLSPSRQGKLDGFLLRFAPGAVPSPTGTPPSPTPTTPGPDPSETLETPVPTTAVPTTAVTTTPGTTTPSPTSGSATPSATPTATKTHMQTPTLETPVTATPTATLETGNAIYVPSCESS